MQAMQDRCGSDKERQKNLAKSNPKNDPDGGAAYRKALQEKADEAAKAAGQDPKNAQKQAAAAKAQSDATKTQNAYCRAVQGNQIASGETGSGNGVVPKNPRF
jgi:peptidoglycan hydrolase CwlO-like protein